MSSFDFEMEVELDRIDTEVETVLDTDTETDFDVDSDDNIECEYPVDQRPASLDRSHYPIIILEVDSDSESVGEENAPFLTLDEPIDEGSRKNRVLSCGRGRCGRSGRGRASRRGHSTRGGRGSSNTQTKWEFGNPLVEVWTNDSDVPPELAQMAREAMKEREERFNIQQDRMDEFNDAIDGRGKSLLQGEDRFFQWSAMDSFQGREEEFRVGHTGSLESYSSEYDAFRSYWDDDILELIVDRTNSYAANIQSTTFQSDWYNTNLHEILCLFAFWMMLGIIQMPTIKSCFTTHKLLKTDVFRKIFTQRRYTCLVRALNFLDFDKAVPTTRDSVASFDRLCRLRPIIDHLNNKFQNNYVMSQNICIDESLILWKGKLDIKQFVPSKIAKFGIRTFELCESATGYLWSFIIYTGKHSSREQISLVHTSTAIVTALINPLLNKGYKLFMDSCYNSPLLARWLKRNGTDCVGSLCISRLDVPPLVQSAQLNRGQFIARHSGDVSVLSWQDKKRVTMLSTCHGSATALATVQSRPNSNRRLEFKPQMVLEYNKFMGGVDLKDQMLEPYLIERKRCAKWYMKLFKRLLNVSILNSRILFNSSKSHLHQNHLSFRLQLVESILDKHLARSRLILRRQNTKPSATSLQHLRTLGNAHWPVLLTRPEGNAPDNRQLRRKCVVCTREGRKNHKTMYMCETCRVPLCVLNCMKTYHTP